MELPTDSKTFLHMEPGPRVPGLGPALGDPEEKARRLSLTPRASRAGRGLLRALAPLPSYCSSGLLPDYLSRNFYCKPAKARQLGWNVRGPGRTGGNAEAEAPGLLPSGVWMVCLSCFWACLSFVLFVPSFCLRLVLV